MAWFFMPFGVLMPAVRPPWSMAPEDEMTMQVRVRDPRHLEPLREIMGDKLGPTVLTPTFDYEARAYCRPADFAEAMAKIITEIDYERFKPTTRRFPLTDGQLHGFYTSIWSLMLSRISTAKHKRQYAAGATKSDVIAAAGRADIQVPSYVRDDKPMTRSGYAPGAPTSGEFDWDELDRLNTLHEPTTFTKAAGEVEIDYPEDDPDYEADLEAEDAALFQADMDDLIDRLPPGYLELPLEQRTEIFKSFDDAVGVSQEDWDRYVESRQERVADEEDDYADAKAELRDQRHRQQYRGVEEQTTYMEALDAERRARPDHALTEIVAPVDSTRKFEPTHVPGPGTVSYTDTSDTTPAGYTPEGWKTYLDNLRARAARREDGQDPDNDWFFDGLKRSEAHGLNPQAAENLLTAILSPTDPADAPDYLSKAEVHRALGIKWPHQRRKFARFLKQHHEWSVFNDFIADDIPQLKAEWKDYRKGSRA